MDRQPRNRRKLTPDNLLYAAWSLGFRGSAYNGAATLGTNTITSGFPGNLVDYDFGSKNEFFGA